MNDHAMVHYTRTLLCKDIQEQELLNGGIIAVKTRGERVEPASIVVKRPNNVGIQNAAEGHQRYGHDSNRVLEHGGEYFHFTDAALKRIWRSPRISN
jgi:hypothetical protein